jgi:hypothetical protein
MMAMTSQANEKNPHPAQRLCRPTALDRRKFLVGLGMIGIGCLPFFGACSRPESISGSPENQRKGAKMTLQAKLKERGRPIPAIDVAVPASFETATFALG